MVSDEQVLANFVAKLKARHPSAIAKLRYLAHRHWHRDKRATAALYRIAAAMKGPEVAAGFDLRTIPFTILGLVQGVGRLGGKAIGLAGRVIEGTGRIVAKTGTAVARPFRFAEHKLGGTKPLRLLPPHRHVP